MSKVYQRQPPVPVCKVEAWALEYHDTYANSHKVYRVYLVSPPAAPAYWLAQWGPHVIPPGGGQWQQHNDGYGSRRQAESQITKKMAKGYVQTTHTMFDVTTPTPHELDETRIGAFTTKVPPASPVTSAAAKKHEAQVRNSLLEMMKKAGRA